MPYDNYIQCMFRSCTARGGYCQHRPNGVPVAQVPMASLTDLEYCNPFLKLELKILSLPKSHVWEIRALDLHFLAHIDATCIFTAWAIFTVVLLDHINGLKSNFCHVIGFPDSTLKYLCHCTFAVFPPKLYKILLSNLYSFEPKTLPWN